MDSPDHVDAPISLAGSHAAIDRLLRQRLRRYAADEDDLDDIVQETWLTALVHTQGLREARSATGWVLRIGHRVALTRFRREGVLQRWHDALAPYAEWSTEPDADARAHHAAHNRQELLDAVMDAVMALPERERQVALLRWFAGFSTLETAEQLAIASGTVKAALHHARARMRAMLAGPVGAAGPLPSPRTVDPIGRVAASG